MPGDLWQQLHDYSRKKKIKLEVLAEVREGLPHEEIWTVTLEVDEKQYTATGAKKIVARDGAATLALKALDHNDGETEAGTASSSTDD